MITSLHSSLSAVLLLCSLYEGDGPLRLPCADHLPTPVPRYYYPQMTPDEAMLIKQWDSAGRVGDGEHGHALLRSLRLGSASPGSNRPTSDYDRATSLSLYFPPTAFALRKRAPVNLGLRTAHGVC